MSSLLQGNGDDYPDAASKHLADARALLAAARADGAAYLAGYVVECALKTILQVATGRAPKVHSLIDLTSRVASSSAAAGATIARYVTGNVTGIPAASIAGWSETMRYHAPRIAQGDAAGWVLEARAVHDDTVAQMILDGVVQ